MTQGSTSPYPATLRDEDFQSLSLNNSFLDTRNPAASFSPYNHPPSAEQPENDQFRGMFSLNPTEDDYAAGTQYFEHDYDASIPTDALGMQSDHAAPWDYPQTQQDHAAEPTSFRYANNDSTSVGTSLVPPQQTSHYSDRTTANDFSTPQNPDIAPSYPSRLDDDAFEAIPRDANTWAPIPRIANIEPPPEVISMYQKAFSPETNDETPDREHLQRPEVSAAIESALMHFEFSMHADGSQRIADDTSNYFNLEPRLTADTIRSVAGQMRNTLQTQVTKLDLLTGHPVSEQLDTTTPSIPTQTTDTSSKRTASTAGLEENNGKSGKKLKTKIPRKETEEKPYQYKLSTKISLQKATDTTSYFSNTSQKNIATWLLLNAEAPATQRLSLLEAVVKKQDIKAHGKLRKVLDTKEGKAFLDFPKAPEEEKKAKALITGLKSDTLTTDVTIEDASNRISYFNHTNKSGITTWLAHHAKAEAKEKLEFLEKVANTEDIQVQSHLRNALNTDEGKAFLNFSQMSPQKQKKAKATIARLKSDTLTTDITIEDASNHRAYFSQTNESDMAEWFAHYAEAEAQERLGLLEKFAAGINQRAKGNLQKALNKDDGKAFIDFSKASKDIQEKAKAAIKKLG